MGRLIQASRAGRGWAGRSWGYAFQVVETGFAGWLTGFQTMSKERTGRSFCLHPVRYSVI